MNLKKLLTYEDGTRIRFIAMAVKTKEGISKAQTPFIDLNISDKSASVEGKIWGATEDHIKYFEVPVVTYLTGKLGTYNNKRQIIVDSMEDVPENTSLTPYIRSAPLDSVEMFTKILDRVDKFEDIDLKDLVFSLLNKVGAKLLSAPAAKTHHHNYYGGILYHLTGMLVMSDSICSFRPEIYKELLDGGIILHDLAKVEELEHKYGMVSDYTIEGKLAGHIVMVDRWITEYRVRNNKMENKTLDLLQHVLLSHHNLREWGSPVEPQCLEAVVLHYIDQLDAKTQMAVDALSETTEEWTGKVFALENKQLYNHRLGHHSTEVTEMQLFKKEE